MKILRYISMGLAGVLIISVMIANVFYKDIRKMIDSEYLRISIRNEQLLRMNQTNDSDYSFFLTTDRNLYYPFQKITVMGRIVKKSDNTIPDEAVIEVEFMNDNTVLPNINGDTTIRLNYLKDQKLWVGYWYPLSNSVQGNIKMRASGYFSSPQEVLKTEENFYIAENNCKYPIAKGISFLGIDSKERISKRSMLSPEGKESDWEEIPRWIRVMSADGVMMLGGISQTFDEKTTMDSPWDSDKLDESLTLAGKVNQSGKRFGVWIKALTVEGTYLERIGYKSAWILENNSPKKADSVISLLDANRKDQISRLFMSYMDNPSVDYVGLSHIFNDKTYDIELFSRFVEEFDVRFPKLRNSGETTSKYLEIANRLSDPNIALYFKYWKNYFLFDYLKSIIDKSGHKKPLFYFTSLDELEKNPDLIAIVMNAGIDFLVFSVSVNYNDIASVLDRLKQITRLEDYYNRVIVSYEIDYKNMPDSQNGITAIENFVNANIQIVKQGSSLMNSQGILINDLYRAMFGKRGPYSPYDWMLGIGKTIFDFKSINKNIPVKISSFVSPSKTKANVYELKLRIENTTSSSLYNFRVGFLPVVQGVDVEKLAKKIAVLPAAAEIVMTIPLDYEIRESKLKKREFLGYSLFMVGRCKRFGFAGQPV